MIAGRPVAARASLTDASTASAPEFDRNACHGPPGRRSWSRSYSRRPGSWYRMFCWPWSSLVACSAMAAATRGWAWPVLVTPIPDE